MTATRKSRPDAYARTLDAIAAARLPKDVAGRLAAALMREGEKARRWRDAGCADPYAAARAAQAAAREKMDAFRNAALRLAQGFEGPPGTAIADAWLSAALRVRQEGVRVVASTKPCGEVDMAAALARFMRLVASEADRNTGAGAGLANLHLFVAPPFIFAQPIHDNPRWGDAVARGLLWRATWHARRLTGGRGARSVGAPMWTGGRPLWPVAAALVADVTGEECSADHAADALGAFIRRNPGVGFHEWPEPNPDT